jgi:small subunit ribosomal protein S5
MSNSKYKNVELVKPSGLELKDRLVSVNRVKVTKVELSVLLL